MTDPSSSVPASDKAPISAADTSETAKDAAGATALSASIQQIESTIEAILFAAGHPVAYDRLSSVIGLPPHEIRLLVARMADTYTDRGIQLLLYPDTCQLCTREEYVTYIREALGIRRGGNLSASSMEVLAIVAYNQPITRAYVDTIRGVDSSYAVSSLLDKGLIEITGRMNAPGRPALFATTDKFLRVFGLPSLAELPATDAFSTAEATETVTDPQPSSGDPPSGETTGTAPQAPDIKGGRSDGA